VQPSAPSLQPNPPRGRDSDLSARPSRNAAHGASPAVERSGTLGHPNPCHLAPTGRTVTTPTLLRVPLQGTEHVVWRGPRGSTPGFHRLPLRGTSTRRISPRTCIPLPSWPQPVSPAPQRLCGNPPFPHRSFRLISLTRLGKAWPKSSK
jgi:hypothetical protein